MMVIEEMKTIESREELKRFLEGFSLEEQCELLDDTISSLNYEIESDLFYGDTGIALYKMSQLTLLEKELKIIKIKLIRQGAYI